MAIRANDWAQLPYFLAVARFGSLRAAAEEMGATHATVDRNLKALEQAYGACLFNRSRCGLKLTPAGEALILMAETAEDIWSASADRSAEPGCIGTRSS